MVRVRHPLVIVHLEWIAVLAGLPALALVWRVHEGTGNRSSLSSVWTSFLIGLLLTVPAIVAGLGARMAFVDDLTGAGHALGTAFLVASLPEEGLRLLALVAYATAQPRFLGPREGVTHGLAVGLGFAVAEGIVYADSVSTDVLLLRSITTVPFHGLLGVLMGFRVGRAVLRKGREARELVKAFALPFVLHGLYDASLLLAASETPADAGDPSTAAYLLGSVAVLAMFASGLIVRRIARRLDREDALDGSVHPHPESRAGEVASAAWSRIVAGGLTSAIGIWLLVGTYAFPPRGDPLGPRLELALVIVQATSLLLIIGGHAVALRGLALRRVGQRTR